MNFSFDLFGFNFLPRDGIYGVWILGIKDWSDMHRNLFCLHYDEGEIRFELFWFRVV